MNNEEMLKRILELEEENNHLLRKIRRGAIWSGIWTFIYWMVIIGLGVGSFYYLQPYIGFMNNVIHAISNNASSTNSMNVNMVSAFKTFFAK